MTQTNEELEKQQHYNDIALFRYAIISALVVKINEGRINDYCIEASKKLYKLENKEIKVSASTIKAWYYAYCQEGLKGLEKKTRKDKHSSKSMLDETILRIRVLREKMPSITGTAMYKLLIKEGYLNAKDISLSSFLRYLQNNDLKAQYASNFDRRKYEQEFANDCWQADTSHGPYIKIKGKKEKTYIIMFIDDKSRLITGIEIFFNDNAINMQKVFKRACTTYGIPKKLYVDNGGPYSNKQLSLICARLGLQLIHARPYAPEGKAKCERMFRSIKDKWMRASDWSEWNSLEDINISLKNYLLENYTNKIHSSTGQTPNNRWHDDYEKVRKINEEEIKGSFYHEIKRKVLKDRTIKVDNEYYEVPLNYVGKTITLRYDPQDMESLYILTEDNKLEEVNKVDMVANSKTKRVSQLDYEEEGK